MKTQTFKIALFTFVFSLALTNTNMASNNELKPMQTNFCTGITAVLDLSLPTDLDNLNSESVKVDLPSDELSKAHIDEGITHDENLEIEDWMTNDLLFRYKGDKTKKVTEEEPLKIESWMSDQKCWKL